MDSDWPCRGRRRQSSERAKEPFSRRENIIRPKQLAWRWFYATLGMPIEEMKLVESFNFHCCQQKLLLFFYFFRWHNKVSSLTVIR